MNYIDVLENKFSLELSIKSSKSFYLKTVKIKLKKIRIKLTMLVYSSASQIFGRGDTFLRKKCVLRHPNLNFEGMTVTISKFSTRRDTQFFFLRHPEVSRHIVWEALVYRNMRLLLLIKGLILKKKRENMIN
jgi:hypothetical protein